MLILVAFLLLALACILIGSPNWKSPPVGVGMLLAAVSAAAVVYLMINRG